jgi:DNA-binding NtrC family response regulator
MLPTRGDAHDLVVQRTGQRKLRKEWNLSKRQVLIIDDEADLSRVLEYNLGRQGYDVSVAQTGAQGLKLVEAGFSGVVLLDLRLPDREGLDLVTPILDASPGSRIVMISAHGSVDVALEATRRGAYDFVSKAGDLLGRVTVSLKNAFRDRDMTATVTRLEAEVSGRHRFGQIAARSRAMGHVFDTLNHLVDSKVTVLLTGESGTGKELAARAIHAKGPRREGPFVAVNCAGIPDTLLESELFGHERGAFTGAVATTRGKFEQSDGGTIFLDEIGEMPLALQSKILRVLQERKVERVGGSAERPVDLRVISATNRDLLAMMHAGQFREDLYYRLAVFPVHLPALRERDGDIPLLADHFLKEQAKEANKPLAGFTRDAMDALEAYGFPGNVRELENLVSRAVVVAEGPLVGLLDLPPAVRYASLGTAEERANGDALRGVTFGGALGVLYRRPGDLPSLETVEREFLRHALILTGGNIQEAARHLGMSRATVYRRIEQLGGKAQLLGAEPAGGARSSASSASRDADVSEPAESPIAVRASAR